MDNRLFDSRAGSHFCAGILFIYFVIFPIQVIFKEQGDNLQLFYLF